MLCKRIRMVIVSSSNSSDVAQEEKKGNSGMCVERNSRLPVAYGQKQEEPAINYTMSVIEHGIEVQRKRGNSAEEKEITAG
jgi:hypothetical protein